MTYKKGKTQNNIRKIRESKLLSEADIARRTGLTPPSVKRIEDGGFCRMETKRKILEVLGLGHDEQEKVFLEDY
jgi:predicted transcriptional regulator